MVDPLSESPELAARARHRLEGPLGVVVLAALVGALAGAVVAFYTAQLNPRVLVSKRDTAWLLFWLVAGYSLAWALLMGAVASVAALVLRVQEHRRAVLRGAFSVALLLPLLWLALLPDSGLLPGVLGWLLFAVGARGTLLVVAGLAVVLGALGAFVAARATSLLRGRFVSVLVLALSLALAVSCGLTLWLKAPPDTTAATAAGHPPRLGPLDDPHPVLLLCIDGLDPALLREMVEAGELPTFARLIETGVFGRLETLEPTLSPAIWTTLVTGKLPRDHGIEGFVVTTLPGMRQAVRRFPLHTGLNFQVLPRLERLPGVPRLRVPYTSAMRREPALWNIAGTELPVGVWGWRVTWPVEEVNGFMSAAPVTLDEVILTRAASAQPSRRYFPLGLQAGLKRPLLRTATDAQLAQRFTSTGGGALPRRANQVLSNSLEEQTAYWLPLLQRRFETRLTIAAFYSVDAFNHLFGHDHTFGGRFEPALRERYRFVDARLKQLLERFPRRNLIIVSDHGFDFENNHHAYAPAGVFLGRGPAFRRNETVVGLSVTEITPLVLYLLGLPAGQDMPGVSSPVWRATLEERVLARRLPRTTPTWSHLGSSTGAPEASPQHEQILEELRELGYIE